jgi:predicted CoA-binding protein
MDDGEKTRRILLTHRTLAVVGLSAQWHRPSYFAAKYMQEHGYRVIPVNPSYDTILGEKCYKSVRDIPVPVDIVDCFRKGSEIPAIAEDAIAIGARCSGCSWACAMPRRGPVPRGPGWKWSRIAA